MHFLFEKNLRSPEHAAILPSLHHDVLCTAWERGHARRLLRSLLRLGQRPQRAITRAVISAAEGGFSPRPRTCSSSWMTSAAA